MSEVFNWVLLYIVVLYMLNQIPLYDLEQLVLILFFIAAGDLRMDSCYRTYFLADL